MTDTSSEAEDMTFAEVLIEYDATQRAFQNAQHRLVHRLHMALRRSLQPGDVIDVEPRPSLPEFLQLAKVQRGNGHGAHQFVLKDVATVQPDAHLELFRWSCQAFPISPSNGLPLTSEVTLQGHFVNPYLDPDGPDPRGRLDLWVEHADLDGGGDLGWRRRPGLVTPHPPARPTRRQP